MITQPVSPQGPQSTQPENQPPEEPAEPYQDLWLTVGPGDSVSSMALSIYGFYNPFVLALVQMANPEVLNLDLVLDGQKLHFPKLAPEGRIFKVEGAAFGICLAVFRSKKEAGSWGLRFQREGGPEPEVEAMSLTPEITVYRVGLRGFPDRKAALRRYRNLSDMPILVKLEEKNYE